MQNNTKFQQLDSVPDILSDEAIALRKRWLGLTAEDEELITQVDDLLAENLDPLIEDMYSHFLSFPETRAYFPDEATLARAQKGQRKYFEQLTKGKYDAQYVAQRLQVGNTHHRIALDPKWYLGAYNRIMDWMSRLVHEKYAAEPEKARRIMSSVNRLIFFDMGLAIDSYMTAKEASIREHRDAIAELETEKRVTKSILEDAPIGIVRLDERLTCLECNQEFLEFLDSGERANVIGRSLLEVAPNLSQDAFESVIATAQPRRKSAELLCFSLDPAQGTGYWDWAIWPTKNESGAISGLVAIFVNATDRVLLQQQREDFVATLTHDLKTPILAANRAIKLLIDGDFGEVTKPQSQILDTIHQSNETLYTLVQTLLDVYRYDSGAKRLTIGSHDLADMVRKVIEGLQPLAATRNIVLSSQVPDKTQPIPCDIEELRRVLRNLVDNSLKFTPAGGSIHVEMQQEPSKEGTLIKVTDTGKGISEQDKPKLFQRFWQAASSGRYYASTGLGLYLCRKIVESHGGSIWCESTLGQGSTFYFSVKNVIIQNSQ